jgi:hypothetical protein
MLHPRLLREASGNHTTLWCDLDGWLNVSEQLNIPTEGKIPIPAEAAPNSLVDEWDKHMEATTGRQWMSLARSMVVARASPQSYC